MIRSDLHVHTTYSDGKNGVEENILSAIDKGMEKIGFSDHSYTFFDESYCMKKEDINRYKQEINALKAKYASKIEVLCGVEQDVYSAESTTGYDYAIGAVHYMKIEDKFVTVDESAETLKKAADEFYGGDMYRLTEKYFETVELLAEKEFDVIAHFDLITKFNEREKLFDEKDERYIKAWKKAADKLLLTGKPFEINTGAIARGLRTFPYPSYEIIEYIKANGGKLVLSSDSHKKENIAYDFNKYEYLI